MKKTLYQLCLLAVISLFSQAMFAQQDPCSAIAVDLTDAAQCPHAQTNYNVPTSGTADGFQGSGGCTLDGSIATWIAITIPADATQLTLTMDDSFGGCDEVFCFTDGTAQLFGGADCNSLSIVPGGECLDLSDGITNANNTPLVVSGLTGGATYYLRLTEEDDQSADLPFTFSTDGNCPELCAASACKDVTICIDGLAINTNVSNDDAFSDLDVTLELGGVVYQWDNSVASEDGVEYAVGAANSGEDACSGDGQQACISFTTTFDNTDGFIIPNVSAWEEDYGGCGTDCDYNDGVSSCSGLFDDADDPNPGAPNGVNAVIENISQNDPDAKFVIGAFEFFYSITSCTALYELQSNGASIGVCSNEGTSDETDDTYTFDLNPVITDVNAAANLTGTYDIAFSSAPSNGYTAPTGNTLGSATTFGPLLISDGAQIVTVTAAGGCITFDVLISPPASCSSVTCPTLNGITSDAAGDACDNVTVVYTAAASAGVYGTDYTITWYENGAPISTVVDNGDGTATWNAAATGCDAVSEPNVSAELICVEDGSSGTLVLNSTTTITVYPTPDATQVVASRDDDVCNYTLSHPCPNFTLDVTTTTSAPGSTGATVDVMVTSGASCSAMTQVALEDCPSVDPACNISNGTWSK